MAESEVELLPPVDVVLAARMVMGSIDLDPWSCTVQNKLVKSGRYFNRDQEDLDDICSRDWESLGERRAFLALKGAKPTRRILNKLLQEYRVGRVKEAVIWLQHSESLSRCPWLWNFPVCIPFKRLRPVWFDDEVETFRSFSPSAWSVVIYLPPSDDAEEYHTRLARFSSAFAEKGRIIHDEIQGLGDIDGDGDWEAGFKKATGHAYNYRA